MIDFYSIRTFDEITEFHCIMPMSNIPSILIHGILSYDQVSKMEHESIALEDVQNRRDKQVPGGLKIHQYANLYFHARNPMLYLRKDKLICILRVTKSICDLPEIVISDRNAASNWVRFFSLSQASSLDFEKIYAKYWKDRFADERLNMDMTSKKCAEILIPHSIPPDYIIGAYVKNEEEKNSLQELGFDRQIEVNTEMFFR